MSLGMIINKELVGNLIILLAERCAPLYHTKLLKLLYLIDEAAIKDSGVPITWLDYKAWQYGPVDPALFNLPGNFPEYINVIKEDNPSGGVSTRIVPVGEFNDARFSDYDLDIIESVLSRYGNKTATELVSITHRKGSPWDIATKKNSIDFSVANISDISLDMGCIVKDDDDKYSRFLEAQEIAILRSNLK